MEEQKKVRCAIYTRKSTDEGLDKEFNTLEAQREAGANYILSQKHQGWVLLDERYDDGGFSGGNINRPALKRLINDVEAGKIDMIVVYKIDRLTRSLADFSKLIEVLDKHKCSFVSVTQNFNTYDSMGRLTLNVLLSFAQFEREVGAERIRDKVAASRKKGMWMGGKEHCDDIYNYAKCYTNIIFSETNDKELNEIFSDSSDKIATVELFGCTNKEQALREATYMALANRYRRRIVTFTTELEGLIPSYGDLIAITHDMAQWGQGGEILKQEGLKLTLSEPVISYHSGKK